MTWSFARFSREPVAVGAAALVLGLSLAACRQDVAPAPADPATREASDVVRQALEGVDPVLAVVGDEAIRLEDVSTDVAMQVWRRQVDIHALLQREVERRVEARLLEGEARRRGLTPEALVQTEIEARTEPVTDAELDAWLAEHPQEAAMGEAARPRVALFLNETRRQEARLAFLQELRQAAGVEVRLAPPPRPRVRVPLDGAPSRGAAQAPLTLVHFGVPSDRASAEVAGWIRVLAERHPDRIREVSRPVLAGRDEVGLAAALVGYVAQDAGLYWEWYDRLAARAGEVDREAVLAAAVEVGLAQDRLQSALEDEAGLRRLREDISAARALGVEAPPVVYVNGEYFSASFGREAFEAEVEAALSGVEAEG